MRYHGLSMFFCPAVVPLVCLATLLVPRWDKLKVKHTWKAVPDNWESLGPPPADITFNLYVALRPHHKNALIRALYEVSTPKHPKYGAHLSKEQVAELVAPHPDTLELVNSWLNYHGVPSSSVSTTHGGGWLTITGVSVFKANDILGASYQLYRHTETNETIVRTVGYSLPEALHSHVTTVAPTTHFASTWGQTTKKSSDRTAAKVVKSASGEAATALSVRDTQKVNVRVNAEFLHWLYQTYAYEPAATSRNKLGIAGFAGEYPSPTDLEMFMKEFHGPYIGATYKVIPVNYGGYDPTKPGLEANVDIQYTEVMTYPTPITYYSTGKGALGKDDGYLSWLHFILAEPNVPPTISTSYAGYEKNFPRDYAIAVCDLYAELGARGVTVLFATGDKGVGGKKDCMIDGKPRFLPTFPASCPWVTSVGGTTNYPEIAAELSGGGFSDYFERPDYQDEAVPIFFENLGSKYAGLYNASGRGIPDIAAQALEIPVAVLGKFIYAEGTSCATPILAGVIALLNDYRLSQDKHALGFINPWLYGDARTGLNDITSGTNPGCNTEGFSAIEGWDPVTGLGTPDFLELQSRARTFIPLYTPTPTPSPTPSIGSTTLPSVTPSTTGTPSAPLAPPSVSQSASQHTPTASTKT